MFGFLFSKKRHEVIRFMQRQMNRSRVRGVSPGQRALGRDPFCQVVWIIPDDDLQSPVFRAAFPAVTRDISAKGLSFIHTQPVRSDSVVVGLHDELGTSFVRCSVEHSTPLGYGFYVIGVDPQELLTPDCPDAEAFQTRVQQFDVRAKTREMAALT